LRRRELRRSPADRTLGDLLSAAPPILPTPSQARLPLVASSAILSRPARPLLLRRRAVLATVPAAAPCRVRGGAVPTSATFAAPFCRLVRLLQHFCQVARLLRLQNSHNLPWASRLAALPARNLTEALKHPAGNPCRLMKSGSPFAHLQGELAIQEPGATPAVDFAPGSIL
jgi:hypothetical protein